MKQSQNKPLRTLVAVALAAMLSGLSAFSHAEKPVCDIRDLRPECRGFLMLKNAPRTDAAHGVSKVDSSYACDLRQVFGQCRQYSLLREAEASLANIEESCQSMQGVFSRQPCPAEGRLAVCTDIVRNYHKPDVMYDNHYYPTATMDWTPETLTRVCQDLGGEISFPGE